MSENKERKNNKFEFNFRGQEVIFEIDQVAGKSDKSILGRYGNTTILTVLIAKELTKNVNSFFPLTITVEEKFYAVGRIPGGFSKREGKSSYDAVVIARLIDRSLRSFFPLGVNQEVQIINHILSVDPACDATMLAAWNSVLVCFLSPLLPYFSIPLATVINNELGESGEFLGELIVSATKEKIVMLELEAPEIPEDKLLSAVELAHQEICYLIGFFEYIANSLRIKKEEREINHLAERTAVEFEEKVKVCLTRIFRDPNYSWWEKEKQWKKSQLLIIKECRQSNPQWEEEYVVDLIQKFADNNLKKLMNETQISQRQRLDGRYFDTIRPLKIHLDYLSAVHGSALFARGNTEVLSVTTIGKISEKQVVDSVFSRSHKHFIHHYNFPSFAVNELASYRNVSRREIGHGELVEKTFTSLIPSLNSFPYTIRAVSEVFSSDGSSSQAAICATSLALMTTGVPLIRPAAGIALGLFAGQIYTDINGLEDKLGEMDFKIAGTEQGICSCQLDVKNQGITKELLKESLEKGRTARLYILQEMKKYIYQPRPNLPAQVIKCQKFFVAKEKIGWIIGPNGKTINQLTNNTGATIEIQPDGCILVYHPEEKQLTTVFNLIQDIITRRKS